RAAGGPSPVPRHGPLSRRPMGESDGIAAAHLRVARPTDELDAVVRFYQDGLGFAVLAEIKDHDGFDGVMLGHAGAAYSRPEVQLMQLTHPISRGAGSHSRRLCRLVVGVAGFPVEHPRVGFEKAVPDDILIYRDLTI